MICMPDPVHMNMGKLCLHYGPSSTISQKFYEESNKPVSWQILWTSPLVAKESLLLNPISPNIGFQCYTQHGGKCWNPEAHLATESEARLCFQVQTTLHVCLNTAYKGMYLPWARSKPIAQAIDLIYWLSGLLSFTVALSHWHLGLKCCYITICSSQIGVRFRI